MNPAPIVEGESGDDNKPGFNMNHLNNITNDAKTFDDSNSAPNQKKDLIDLKTYNGTLMLLFNEMVQINIHYSAYWFLQYFVPIIQLLIVIISPFVQNIWDSSDKVGNAVRYMSCALSFSPCSYDNSFDLAGSVVISIIYIVIGIWFCVIPAIYLVLKNYPKPILYISVIFSQVCFPLLLIPFATHVGLVFTSISNNITGGEVFIIIFLVVVFILVLIGHTFLASMNAFLISPNPSLIASYKGFHPALVLTCSSLYIVLTSVSLKFAKWMVIFIMVLHIACNVYFIIDTFTFPFVRFGTHFFAASLYTATIIGHIINIPVVCDVKIPELYRVIIPYAIFIIGLIAYYFVFKSMQNKIRTILSFTEAQTDNDKREYYDSLGITSSWEFDKMCRIGMSLLSPLFIDWTFPIYAGEMTSSIPSMMCTALFVTFFPGEQQAAMYFIDQITKQPVSSFRERFIVYRVKSTYLRRFTSNSEESTAAYVAAMKESDSTLSIIQKFWLKISADPNSIEMRELETIGERIDAAKRKWKKGLQDYPNDPRFSSGYSHFLLETLVDPENGVFMKLKSAHLRKGFNSEIDPIFRAFAIARPFIFHEKLCDKKGNIKRNAFEITNGTTVTITATALEKLQEDVDSGAVDKMISDLYHWPNLRKSFKRATSHYKPRLMTVAYALNVFIFIAAIVLAIILFIKIIPIFDDAIEYFNRIEYAMTLRSKIALGKCAMMLHWAKYNNIIFNDDDFKQELVDQSVLDEHLALRYTGIEQQVAEAMSAIVSSYIDFAKSFSKFMASSDNTTYDVLIFGAQIVDRDLCFLNGTIQTHETLSFKNAIILLIYTYYQSAYGNINFTDFTTSQLLCQVDTLMNSIPNSIDNGVDFTRFSLNQALDSNKKVLKNFTAVYIVLVIVFCILLNFTLIAYYVDAKVIFSSLKSLDQTAAAHGANPVLITAEQEDVSQVVYAIERVGTFDIVMIVMNVVFTIIMIVVFIIIFTTTLDTNDNTLNFINWCISGAKRLSLAYQALAQLFEALIFENSFSPYFTSFTETNEHAKELLSQLWDAEVEFFNGPDGIKGNFKDIDDLHTSDQCHAAAAAAKRHDFYECLGLDQLLSTYIMYGSNVVVGTPFNHSDILNFFHMGAAEVTERLDRSEVLVRNHMNKDINNQIILNIVMLIIFILSLIGLTICVHQNAKRLRLIIKAALILLRRIPPPAIANCKQLKDILIGSIRNSDDSDVLAQEVIFDSLPTAVLAVAKDGTIEAMNEKAKQLFGFLTGQIVGQKLDCLIHNVDENEMNVGNDQISEEDAGAIRLYHLLMNDEEEEIRLEEVDNNRSTIASSMASKANIMQSKANINANQKGGNKEKENKDNNKEKDKDKDHKVTSSSQPMFVNCHCSDDSNVRCEASLFPIEDYNGVRNNFILFLGETKENLSMEAKLKEAKDEVTRLKNQLIPSDVQGFIRGDRKDFSFLSKTVTVVAIQIYGFFESIKKIGYKEFLSKVDKLFVHLECGCVQFPPMMKQRQFTDTFIALGGLFNVTDAPSVHAQAALQYAMKMVEDALDQDNKFEFDFRIQIGISTGGPLVCGLVGEEIKEFDAAGPLITEAITLAENAAPCRILVSQSTKELLPEQQFESHSIIDNNIQTYYVPNLSDQKISLVSSMSFMMNSSRTNLTSRLPDSLKTSSNLLDKPILEDIESHEDEDIQEEEEEKSTNEESPKK